MEIKEQDLFANIVEDDNTPSKDSRIETSTEVIEKEAEAIPTEDKREEEPVMTRTTTEVNTALEPEYASKNSSTPEPKTRTGNIAWQLFITFFKIGVVTFGGGYAMIPMIEAEVVDKKKWIEKDIFLDLIAIAQTCPGVFAINISTFIGYKLRKKHGACLAALGAALPSFIIILLLATTFRQIQDVEWVAACFRGIRPAVVALIAVPTFNLAKSAKIGLINCWIPIASAALIYALGVNPVFIIIAAAFGGYLYGALIKQ